MDKQIIALFIPIIALAIPVLGIVLSIFSGRHKFLLEQARIQASLGEGSGDIQLLRGELDDVRRELAELQERVDFSERLLAQRPDPQRLPGAPDAR